MFEGLHMSPHKSRYNYLLKAPEEHLPPSVLCLRGWSRGGGWKCRALEREERKEDSEYRTADDPL